jgi:cytochrome c
MNLPRSMKAIVVLSLALLNAHPSAAAGDPLRGAKAFQQCAACHSLKLGEHLTGPSLGRIWGRKAAGEETFLRYSAI